jgi:glycine cleavage system H lipoate-binding protein
LVIEIDQFLLAQSSEFGAIPQINENPYNSGWMVVVQLSKLQELTALLTWQKYRDLIAK